MTSFVSCQITQLRANSILGAAFLRYGKHEGFSNKILKRCHDVGARFQQRTLVSVHENVPNYEEASKLEDVRGQ